MEKYKVRKGFLNDEEQIFTLYKKVSQTLGGLARTHLEIIKDYIHNFCSKSQQNEIQLVITESNTIVAEIHCYTIEPKVFSHVLSELTIAADQNLGLGKFIFQSLLNIISIERTDILRVELIARESNQKAIQFYQKLGFVIEGRFEKRIDNTDGTFEADIPMAWFNKNLK